MLGKLSLAPIHRYKVECRRSKWRLIFLFFFPFFALLPPLSACWCLSLFISNIFSHIWTRHDWHASCQKCRWAVHQTCDEYMKNQPQFWGWGKIDFTTKPIFLLLSSHKYHLKIKKKHIGFVYNKKCVSLCQLEWFVFLIAPFKMVGSFFLELIFDGQNKGQEKHERAMCIVHCAAADLSHSYS